MIDVGTKIATSIALTCLFYVATFKSLGILQQSGYHTNAFKRWVKRKDNMLVARLSHWALCSFFATAFVNAVGSPFGMEVATTLGFIVFMIFSIAYCIVDRKYALKVPVNVTNRFKRLSVGYFFVVACANYLTLSLLSFIAELIGNEVYSLFQFLPFTLMPFALPPLLGATNKILSPFEKANNKKHVHRAGKVLDKAKAIRIGIVGSYGKTSVKNILHALLHEKYSVIMTPESYNTPAGVAKTVNCLNVEETEIFIAEMGARRVGDVAELCELVKPDYAIFVGLCAQHMETFKTEENLINAKCEIVKGTKNVVVCGGALKGKILDYLTETDKKKCLFVDGVASEITLEKDKTRFIYTMQNGEKIEVETAMLGASAVENISIAIALAERLGLTKDELLQGIAKIKPVPHRLQLIESGGVYILDDAYNCSERSAKEAVEALKRFENKKIVVTPGIVEAGILEEKINAELGELLAKSDLDKVILVGETLVKSVSNGYQNANGDMEKLQIVSTLEKAKELLGDMLEEGDAVLFLNDLPDAY